VAHNRDEQYRSAPERSACLFLRYILVAIVSRRLRRAVRGSVCAAAAGVKMIDKSQGSRRKTAGLLPFHHCIIQWLVPSIISKGQIRHLFG